MTKRKNRKLSGRLLDVRLLLTDHYGPQQCPLAHETPFQLLVAVMLSAQCRDERVNAVTPALFGRFPSAAEMSQAEVPIVAEMIRSLGLFRAKAENLVKSAAAIERDFAGEVPAELEKLVTLPGIGRKSANVLLGNAFGKPGFPVDTHVQRLLRRIFSLAGKTPEALEREVCGALDDGYWTDFSHLLIRHGREVCHARKPECAKCFLRGECDLAREELPDQG